MSTVTRTQGSTTASVHSRAVTIAVVLLSAPAMVWGTILLVSVTADDPGLGGLAGSGVAEALGLASVIGLIGAAGAAIVSRIAGGGPARASAETTASPASSAPDAPLAWFEDRSGRRGPAALIAATAIAGGILIAAVTGQLAMGSAPSSTPADQPAAPTSVVEPAEETAVDQADEPAIIFGDHTDH